MFGPVSVVIEIGGQKIGEKKDFQHSEHDDQLDEDDFPESAAHHHGAEAVPVKGVCSYGKSLHLHVPPVWD